VISTKELAGSLDLHKKIVGAQVVHLRAVDGRLRLSSASASGKALITRVNSDAELPEICVDVSILSSFVRGSGSVELAVKDDRLLCRSGRMKGEAPGVAEDSPRIGKVEGSAVSAADADWLSQIIPQISLSGLSNDAFLAAACDGKEWRISCTDDICGAYAFGRGAAKLKFALAPDEASTLSAIISSTDKALSFGASEGRLVISYSGFMAAIPTIEGKALSLDVIAEGKNEEGKSLGAVKDIAKLKGSDIASAVKNLGPFASVKDADPVMLSFSNDSIVIGAKSSSGSLNQKIGAKCSSSIAGSRIGLSYKLLSMLMSKIGDETVLIQALTEEKTVTRITFKTKNAYYLMLTAA
jgi:hypothetical protein